MKLVMMQKAAQVNKILFQLRQDTAYLYKYFYCRFQQRDKLQIIKYFSFIQPNFPEGTMEKAVLNRLDEVARLLILAQENIEYVQKYFISELKKEGRMPGTGDCSSDDPQNPKGKQT
ncbi:hypothetical protein GF337_05970 [candidate division KSB1 bacterium]|nr:hypothetical protein [candidate division KSB1 bacterium]